VEEGLPVVGVFDMVRTPDGLLWIGSEGGGLVRFDGRTFKTWDTEAGLPDNSVRCLAAGPDGKLWGGTAAGGIFSITKRDVAGTDLRIEVPEWGEELSGAHIRSLFWDQEGRMWIAALERGIFVLENGVVRAIPSMFPPETRYRDLEWHEGSLYVATDAGLASVSESVVESCRFGSSAAVLCEGVLHLHRDNRNRLWVTTEEGVYCLIGKETVLLNLPELAIRRVRSAGHQGDDVLWFGTDRGLFRVRVNEALEVLESREFTAKNGLSNDRIRKVLPDDNGILWIATYLGGINKLAGNAWMVFDEKSGIERTGITCVRAENPQRIWMGFFGGHISVWNPDILRTVREFDIAGTGDIRINDILPTGGFDALVMTNNGTYHISPDKPQKLLRRHEARDAAMVGKRTFVAASDGLFLFENETLSKVVSGHFTEVAQRSDSLLLTESMGHLLQIHAQTFRVDTPGQLDGALTGSAVSPSGLIWLTTDDGRVMSFDGTNLRDIKAGRFLSTKTPLSITVDADENLIIGSKKGLEVLELDSENRMVLNATRYWPGNGMTGKEISRNALLTDAAGRLWIGTAGALQTLDQSLIHFDPTPPFPFLTELLLRFEPMDSTAIHYSGLWQNGLPESPVFRFNQNHLTLRWDAIELSGPNEVRFQFMLEGYDPEWSAISIAREVTYGQLNAGSYRFLLRSVNKDGIWNEEPIVYEFTVTAPFWASWWFMVICALAAAGLVWGTIRMRTAMLRKENLILESRVNERTFELAAEKEKSEELLLNILPRAVADELKEKGAADARNYPMVTVLFSDFKDFTKLTQTLGTNELVGILDNYFKAFDRLCERHGVEKIKTIGDAYMCATGLPTPHPEHALRMVRFAADMITEVSRINRDSAARGLPGWEIRIGIHSGPVIAGVVGHRKFAFDIWGDTVNTASRVESAGAPGRINISEATYELIKNHPDLAFENRGNITAKGKGEMGMWFVEITGQF
jgi:class 3 adenylate cyclase/ligand-binding sensor domain-containing protein